MIDLRAVRRYSRALFELARKKSVLEKTDPALLRACELTEKHPEIGHLILNSTISLAEKEDFLEKILGPETEPLVTEFLKVLVRKKRFRELPAIQEEFHKTFEKHQGIQEVLVISAREFPEAYEEKLKAILKRKTGFEIRLQKKTDPGLIGGFILRFDGSEINASFRARLEAIRQSLMD